MKLNGVKRGKDFNEAEFREYVRFYNDCYEKMKKAVESAMALSFTYGIDCGRYDKARDERRGTVTLVCEYDKKCESCSKIIEQLKSKLGSDELTHGERVAYETELKSAYTLFYNYVMERVEVAKKHKEQRIIEEENAKEVLKTGRAVNAEKRKARLAIGRLYQVAKLMENKYGVDLKSESIKNMITPTEEVVDDSSVEAIEE